jgi:hypothetical protein
LKKWVCILVDRHEDIPKNIEEYEETGWKLHTYTCAQAGEGVNHYLLFEKEE